MPNFVIHNTSFCSVRPKRTPGMRITLWPRHDDRGASQAHATPSFCIALVPPNVSYLVLSLVLKALSLVLKALSSVLKGVGMYNCGLTWCSADSKPHLRSVLLAQLPPRSRRHPVAPTVIALNGNDPAYHLTSDGTAFWVSQLHTRHSAAILKWHDSLSE